MERNAAIGKTDGVSSVQASYYSLREELSGYDAYMAQVTSLFISHACLEDARGMPLL